MYITKNISFNEKEIYSFIEMTTGVRYAHEQIKLVHSFNYAEQTTLNFICKHSNTTTIFTLEELLECIGYSRSYSNVIIKYNKPWWNFFGRKIIGFSVDVKI